HVHVILHQMPLFDPTQRPRRKRPQTDVPVNASCSALVDGQASDFARDVSPFWRSKAKDRTKDNKVISGNQDPEQLSQRLVFLALSPA
ncbi:hypothetical protein, partial [Candidatus Accumulibacter vicinus]